MIPISYECRVIEPGRVLKTLWWILNLTLLFMFMMILAQLPVWLVTGLTLLLMVWLVSANVYRAGYTLDDAGIHEQLLPLYPALSFLKNKQRFFKWDEVKAYVLDRDMTRSGIERQFIKIYFHGRRYVPHIAAGLDTAGKKEFELFSQAFVRQLPPGVQVKPGFYRRPAGKMVSLVLGLATIGLLVLLWGMEPTPGHAFRLSFVIIPGVLYMLHRVFSK